MKNPYRVKYSENFKKSPSTIFYGVLRRKIGGKKEKNYPPELQL